MTRHLRVQNDPVYTLQARIRGKAQMLTDDVMYVLEREAFDDVDEDWVKLNQHGIETLTQRAIDTVTAMQNDLKTLKRHLTKRVTND